ncbi:hypothetical protein MMC19_007171 [Ptychographa xylographoides]|nr:hypothetical protein [Ptychographa xylographoides]
MTSTAGSLAVPATQNTAPILEFQCLYTHDLRQKKKRWQDGVLRFHTFNKRVMVYDVERNYIGDSHWRKDAAVQDGDELKLDKGVLIQVREAMGRREQDLTELLERRRLTQDRSPGTGNKNHSIVSRSDGTPLIQLRPKSLNALLGTPKRAYGRAVLPTKSPYENRVEPNSRTYDGEPPIKRARLNSDYKNRNDISPLRHPRNEHESLRVMKKTPKSTAAREIITVNSDNESLMPSSPVTGVPESSSIHKKVVTASKQPRDIVPRRQEAMKRVARSSARTLSAAPEGSKIWRPICPEIFKEDLNSVKENQKPINRLRIASKKPRKKLMYRELLPKTIVVEDPIVLTDASPVQTPELGEKSPSSITISPPPNESEMFRQNQHDLLQSNSEKRFDRVKTRVVEVPRSSDDDSYDRNTSGEAIDRRTIARSGILLKPLDDLNASHDRCWPAHVMVQQDEVSSSAQDGPSKIPLFLSQDVSHRLHKASELAMLDEILRLRPIPSTNPTNANLPFIAQTSHEAAPHPVSNVRQHDIICKALNPPLAISRNLSGPEEALVSHPAWQDHAQSMLRPLPIQPQPPLVAPVTRRSPLRKALSTSSKSNLLKTTIRGRHSLVRAVSDMTGMYETGLAKPGLKRLSGEMQDKDIDPWSREAFDLFGWRPGMEKGKGAVVKVGP